MNCSLGKYIQSSGSVSRVKRKCVQSLVEVCPESGENLSRVSGSVSKNHLEMCPVFITHEIFENHLHYTVEIRIQWKERQTLNAFWED